MRGVLRPGRVGAVCLCLALLTTLAAAPAASSPAARPWMNASLTPRARAELLLAQMTLDEKIGQMTQAERGAVSGDPGLITTWKLGSLLSGGGSTPTPNTPAGSMRRTTICWPRKRGSPASSRSPRGTSPHRTGSSLGAR